MLIAVAAALSAAFIAPAAAQAVTEDFETPALADGTKVGTQFQASSGVYFTENPGAGIYLPEIDDDAPARSGARTLDITTGPPGQEFPHPGLEGRFDNVATDVTVHVRNLFSVAATIELEAHRTSGGVVNDSATVPPGSWVELSVGAGAGDSFHLFQVNAQSGVDDAKEIRVDDLEFTEDPAALPDYNLVTEEVGGVALPGQPKQYEIDIQRLNGFTDSVSFSGHVPGTFGESVSFSPSSTAGNSTTVTMTLPGSAKESPLETLQINSTSSPPPSINRSLNIDFVVESPFSVTAVDPPVVRPHRCATTPFDLRIVRNRFFDGPVDLVVEHQNTAGEIPPDLNVSIAPSTIPPGATVSSATLNVTRGEHPESPSPVPLQIVASRGSVERILPFEILRAPPRLTSLGPTALITPQALLGGTRVTVLGDGLCPGAQVQFGNDQARVPGELTSRPTAEDPTRVQLIASTPRLATSGPISVINPSGTVISGSGSFPDSVVNSYRSRLGFSFPNEDGIWEDLNEDGTTDDRDEPRPVGAGALRDWQELLGPRQTNFDACEIGFPFPGCWEVITPIPTPHHGLMQTILGEASYYNRGGTCVGLAIASRRIAMGQATVNGRPFGGLSAPVWSLQRTGRETIPGRGDIPFEGRARYSPIKYGAILHPAQATAEFIELWVQRRSLNAISGPGAMRTALEGHLRGGRRPMLVINWDGGGHAVNVYDVEDRPGGGYFIRVYDNNYPYLTGEAGDGPAHQNVEENLSRIEVTPGGSWKAPGLPVKVGTDAAGKPIRAPREGPTGDLSWIAVENELPVVPTSLASLDGLRVLATPNLNASISAPASASPRTVKAGVFELGYLDGEGAMVAADSDRARSLSLESKGGGDARVGVFGEDTTAEVRVRGSSASSSAKGGGDQVLLPKGDTEGIGLKARSGSTKVDLTLISDRAGRLARVAGAPGGTTRLELAGKGDRVKLTHAGRPGRVKIELASFGRRDGAARLSTTLRLGRNAKVTLRPKWRQLGSRLPATVNGKRLLLLNRARPPIRVKSMRVGARKRGKQALTRVRARLAGKLGKLDALVVGVEVRRGKKLLGRASRQLPPNRQSVARLAKGITIRSKLKSRSGKLKARATVSAVVAKPLPHGASRSKSSRVR